MKSDPQAIQNQNHSDEQQDESRYLNSRTPSPLGSHRGIELIGLRDRKDNPQSQPIYLETNEDSTKTTPLSACNYGEWASLDDTWLLEIVALVFSVACFIAIIILLRIYDQKPSPDLSHGLTLNTIVSLLATASRSSLLFAVAAAIG